MQIGRWRIAARLLGARIRGRGPAADCDGSCCRHGAYVSLAERDRIMAQTGRLRRLMDATQPRDPTRWFERQLHRDADFPDGVAVGTRTHGGKCVFRTRAGLCSIQRLEERIVLAPGERLKPFYCRLFPITTNGRCLDYDPLIAGRRPCCTLERGGETRGIDAWLTELRMVLGRAGAARLRGRPR